MKFLARILAALALISAGLLATVPAQSETIYGIAKSACGTMSYTPGVVSPAIVTTTGYICFTGALTGLTGSASNASSGVATSSTNIAGVSYNYLFNGTTWDQQLSSVNGTNSTGTGISASGLVAQCDDTSPVTITENLFGNVRMSCANHSLFVSGAIASGAADSGNPVKIGGVYNSSATTLTNGQRGDIQLDSSANLKVTPIDSTGAQANFSSTASVQATSQYPVSATVITGNATGTTGAVVGTLAGTSAKTTYICGFDVSAVGGVAAVGPITIAGLTGSSMVYQLTSAATAVTLSRSFSMCIPASTTNTAITITTTADGTATAVDVNAWGYQL